MQILFGREKYFLKINLIFPYHKYVIEKSIMIIYMNDFQIWLHMPKANPRYMHLFVCIPVQALLATLQVILKIELGLSKSILCDVTWRA